MPNLNIRVPKKLLTDFETACESNYTNKSEVLRRAMVEYVRKNKKEATSMRVVNSETLGRQFNLDQLEQDHGTLADGKYYLTQDAYVETKETYAAVAIDESGSAYWITWEITNPDAQDESDKCDWDNFIAKPY